MNYSGLKIIKSSTHTHTYIQMSAKNHISRRFRPFWVLWHKYLDFFSRKHSFHSEEAKLSHSEKWEKSRQLFGDHKIEIVLITYFILLKCCFNHFKVITLTHHYRNYTFLCEKKVLVSIGFSPYQYFFFIRVADYICVRSHDYLALRLQLFQ